jgi:superfamily I DNA/RNA helicase
MKKLLPKFQDLSKEQDAVYSMSLDGNHVVSGPPGTGKTVMALYRAQALNIDDRAAQVLMHSNVLKQYTLLAAKEVDVEGSVETFHRWIGRFWTEHFDAPAPKMEGDEWAFDWSAMAAAFARRPPRPDTLADLLVDEGQDLSPHFYQLVSMMATNVTVFADENQKLFPDNSTIDEIASGLGRRTESHRLTRNYRNTREIAALAAHFYCGTPSGIPDPPHREGDLPLLRRFSDLTAFIELVARYEKNYSDRSIGVILPNKRLQKQVYNKLSYRKPRNPVEAYIGSYREHRKLDFTTPGIKILNYWQVKGLEFDAVFVPELQLVTGDPTSAETRMRFYVVFSRAREELILSYTGTEEPAIVKDVPDDILERL